MEYDDMRHDTRKGRHYYTTLYRVAKPRQPVYSSDRACPCHALFYHVSSSCHTLYKAPT